MKKTYIILVLIIISKILQAQVSASGDLSTYVNSVITNLPGSSGNDYQNPIGTDLTNWGNVILNILQGNYSTAHTQATAIGYQILEYTDNSVTPNKLYYVLERKSSSSNHWGIFIFNPNASRPKLMIQSPHPKYDSYTGQQGFYIFKKVNALAFYFSGTHRCNSSIETSCDGTTTVCGASGPYKISDQAHNVSGTLQKTTELLNTNISNFIVVQVHGFAKDVGDPDVIMSNGKTSAPTGTDYLVNLKNNLAKIDTTLTFKVIHIDSDWTKLTATTNTQGRLINGSSSPCTDNPVSANGRFLHLEQVLTGLRDNQTNWAKLANAIAMTFPIVSKGTGNWETISSWPGDALPDTIDNVQIASGHTVTVTSSIANCGHIGFESATSKLSLASNSVLSVYGDFKLYSITHSAFSSWTSGAKLCFKGAYDQLLSGWDASLSTTTNTTLMEIQVNKSSKMVYTPGTDMKLSLGTSLEIIKGIFYLNVSDDINGKNFAGSSGSSPLITIQSEGSFVIGDGATHIRSGTSGSNPIGKITVFGKATLASSSSLGINFSNIDIENGAKLTLLSFSNSQPNKFNPGTISAKSGSTVINNSIVSFWSSSAVFDLQSGSVYEISRATTVFPINFTNNGTVEYSANESQTLYMKAYSGLTISGTGDKTLDGDASVSGTLTMNGGGILTGNYSLTLGTGTSNLGAFTRNSGWIVGKFKRWFAASITSAKTMIIGTTTQYRPTSISFTSAPTSGGTLLCFFTETNPGTLGLPLNDNGFSVINTATEGYWTIQSGDGLSGGIYSLNLTPAGFSNVTDMTTLRILKRTISGSWTLNGDHTAGTSTIVKRTNMSGFSEFGIGGGNDNPLPVTLLNFNISNKGFINILKWTTSNEIQNFGWELERKLNNSEDGNLNEWIKIAFINGANNSNSTKSYLFEDRVNINGNYEYRLKQIDLDGTSRYSDTKTINVYEKIDELKLDNYPNPFNPETKIKFEIPKQSRITLTLYNSIGIEMEKLIEEYFNAGSFDYIFNGRKYSSGVYFLKLSSENNFLIKKIILVK